jgi:hypothetical protein
MITLGVVNYEYVWKEGARDAKTMAAWGKSRFATASNLLRTTARLTALYEGLNRAGVIQAEMKRRNMGPAADRDPITEEELSSI